MVRRPTKEGQRTAAVGAWHTVFSWGKAAVATAMVAFVAMLTVGIPTAAFAQDFTAAVSNIKINSGSTTTPIHVYDYFNVTADWAVPDTAVPGDTFELAVDAPIQMLSLPAPVDLKDAAGNIVGTCTVTSAVMKCTLSDYVLTHDNVHGSLYFKASATKEVTGPVIFVVGAVQIPVTVPGGAITIIGAGDAPTSPYKQGWQDLGGTLTWRIVIPGQAMKTTGADLVFTDTYQAGLKLVQPLSFSASRVLASNWNDMDVSGNREYLSEGTGANTFSVLNVNDAANSFDFRFNQPDTSGKYVYMLHYKMAIPSNTLPGTKFSNEVSLDGKTIGSDSVTAISAGGDGTGDAPRSITLSKAVDGSGTAPDVNFEFLMACVDAKNVAISGYPQTVSLKATSSTDFTKIPLGAVCTITETNSHGADKVSFSPSNIIQVTKESPAAIAVKATNTFDLAPMGALKVTKSVVGSGASAVPANTDFTVNYSYPAAVGGDPVTGTLVMKSGGFASLDKLPTGTKVTLSEIVPTTPGLDWAAPKFTVDGAATTGSVIVTIGDATTIEVALENVATAQVGGFSVTKSVTGDGAGSIPNAAEFTVNYSYAGGTGTLVLGNGGTDGVSGLPVGTKVTLSELAPTAVAGVNWAAPVFTVDGVDTTDSVVITIGNKTTVNVALNNVATKAPETPALPDLPFGLALTGSDTGPMLPLAAGLLVVLGGALVFFRRKKPVS